ncbi:MAG: MFS transporter [Candidatus Omnitrophota bacterium]|nr:MFS transporter [Candidatus Omnitrophota bacterium]
MSVSRGDDRSPVSRRWILFFFCCTNVLVSFNISALTAVIPAVSRSLNVPMGDAAGIIPFYIIPYGVCALFYAPLAVRFSIKNLMIAAVALCGFGNWMCLWTDSLNMILLGRVIAGIGAAAVTPLAIMTLGKIFEKDIRGRVLGLFFSSSFFGALLGLVLSAFADWHWLFAVPALLGFVLVFGLWFCPEEGMEANTGVKVNYGDAFRLAGLRRILIFIFFMSLFFHGVCKWYGVYLDKVYNYDQLTISSLIILTAIASVAGQLIGGVVTDKYGRVNSCYIGIAILGLSTMALYGHYSLAFLALVLSMISVGWTIAHNGISTVLTDLSDMYRPELAALNSSVRFFSGGLGFYLSGNFIQMNFGLTFFAIGCLMLAQIIFVPKIIPSTPLRQKSIPDVFGE